MHLLPRILFLVGVAVVSTTATIAVTTLPASVGRGTVFFALRARDLECPSACDALRSAKRALPGLTFVALQYMYTMPAFNSSAVLAPAHKTPNETLMVNFIEAAAALNLSVLVKPVVAPAGTGLMFRIAPTDPVAWFASYAALLLPVAAAAQRHKAWALAVGVELQHLAATQPGMWRELIAAIRVVAPDVQLTYASNPVLLEHLFVHFWDALDFVGLDPYFSLATNATDPTRPTATEMAAQFHGPWSAVVAWWLLEIKPLNRSIPMVITEFGYPSSNRGLVIPYEMARDSDGGCVGPNAGNDTAQASAFATVFNALGATAVGEPGSVAGVAQFWFGMPGTDDYYDDRAEPGSLWACGWTPYGKNESMSVLRRAYDLVRWL